jgi:hypothetical protein
MPAVKEVHYFDLHYDRGLNWYAQHFRPAANSQVVGEATPEYLFLPWARARMSRDLPESRVVVALRDPVERAWSHYNMLLQRGREDLPFEAALDAEAERLQSRNNWSRYGYVAKGRYHEQLEDLFARHGRDNVLVLLFERDVVARPDATFARLCRFIGIDDAPGLSPAVGSTVNAAVDIRSALVRRTTRRLPMVLRNIVGKVNTRTRDNDRMPDAMRERLRSELADSTKSLETLLNTSLAEWSESPAGLQRETGP